MREVVITGGARTPIGSFLGALSSISAPVLGAAAIRAALERSGLPAAEVGEVLMGCVLPAAVGQAPARQAAIGAGIPKHVPAATINKVCGSGLKTVLLGAQAIATGEVDAVVAGGMESMSNAPYALPRARTGLRMGNAELLDLMVHDGLWDPYGNVHMGSCAELCARDKQISRAAQDEFAATSYHRALEAQAAGHFTAEIVGVEIVERKATRKVELDEEPGRGAPDKLPGLKPAFDRQSGTVTAGNASSINDGAAALVLMERGLAERSGRPILARIVASGQFAQEPEWFTTAPAGAIERCLKKAGWEKDSVDLWEINEAFAVVALANLQLLGLDPARVNVWGGAVALGHPIGASGARILVTLLSQLAQRGARRGVASLCIGGGEGIALAVERLS